MKESQHLEWKETWRDEFLRWICGFANAEGGILHIGRNDQGVVVGLPDAAKLLEDIPNKVRDILGILVAVNAHEESGQPWLEIVVDPNPCLRGPPQHLEPVRAARQLDGEKPSRHPSILTLQSRHRQCLFPQW